MPRTIEAVIDENGNVRLLDAVRLEQGTRALVTILESPEAVPDEELPNPAVLSEGALAVDWNRPEEDAAWAHLQPAP